MKKIFISILMLFGAQGALAQTTADAPASPWKVNMGARFRWEDANQFDLYNRKQFSHIRLRPMVTFEGVEKLKIVMEPQFAKVFGNYAYVPSASGAGSAETTLTETSGNSNYGGSIDGFALRNAYMDLSASEYLNLIVGRQALAYGDQYIVGFSDWGVFGRTFDAVRLRSTFGKNWVDVFQAKLVENTASNSNKGDDKDFAGLYMSFVPAESIKALDLYGFYLSDNQKSTANSGSSDTTRPWHFGIYGTRFVTDFGAIGWKFEYAKNFGTENSSYMGDNKENDMIDTQVDYKFGETAKHKVGLQFMMAGQNWRELYGTTTTPFGRTDVLGRRNVTGLGLHWNAVWSDMWTTDVDAYVFQRTKDDTTVFSNNSTTALVTLPAAGSTEKSIGSNVDLIAKYAMNKNLSLSLGACFFQLGAYLKDNSGNETRSPHYGFFMIESKY